VGVDRAGHKHVLGMQQGATENAAAVEDLLEQLVARGVDPKAKRWFVIDGAKALRAAINQVFGAQHPVQRCRNHKIRNVCATACRKNRKIRSRRRCAPATSWRRSKAWRG
jgi:putative transposase